MPDRSSQRRAWEIASLLAVFMSINAADKIVLGLVAVPMMNELGLTPREFGSISSSFYWLFTVGGIVGGFLSDRFRTKALIFIMILIWSICQLPIYGSASIGVIVVSRAVLGLSQGPAWPIAVHALCEWFSDDKRNMPVAIVAQGSGVGLILAGLLVPLVTAGCGWRANFLMLASAGCIWAVIWLVVGGQRSARRDGMRSADTAASVPYFQLLFDRSVLGCIITNFVGYWSLALGLTWLPAYFQLGLGYDSVVSGWLYSFVIVVTIPLGIGLAWCSQLLLKRGFSSGAARGSFFCFFLTFSGVLFAAFYLNLPTNWIRIALIAAGLGCTPIVYSLAPAILAEIVPAPQRGSMLAINNSIASLAGIGAPLVTGVLVQDLSGARGYEIGFALSGIMMIFGGILGMWMIDPARSMRSRHTQVDANFVA